MERVHAMHESFHEKPLNDFFSVAHLYELCWCAYLLCSFLLFRWVSFFYDYDIRRALFFIILI